MRKLLNTLYVTSTEAHLGKEGQNVVVRVEGEVRLRVPIHNLESVVSMGYTGASPALMHLCAERGVAMAFHSPNGRLLARLTPANKGNVLLRKRQYEMHDDPQETLTVSRSVVLGKLANCRTVLRRFIRDYGTDQGASEVEMAVKHLSASIDQAKEVTSTEALRGVEGDGARRYYGVFDHLIRVQKPAFAFTKRSRRPPLDRINALLSFLYSMLAHDCTSALETVGLDSQVGFLHRLRPGRPSLALDIMEELRPYLVDRMTISLINNNQVNPKDFIVKETGAVLLREDSRKKVLNAWQSRKQEVVQHPYLQEKVEVGLIPYAEALLMARYIRGDLDGYPPYLIR
ncbi:MAG: type I-C CRISPR-associated endonuclease Cas1 [Firmicutes bacterium]|nr:type I-C CRISPR-associated endonuclease Cas1 [Bacillota bacterium]